VAINDRVKALPQRRDIKSPMESYRTDNIIDGALRVEMVDKPKTLLRK
jgi:hypothetical protein